MNVLIALSLFIAPALMVGLVVFGIVLSRLKRRAPAAYAAVRRAIVSRIASVGPGASAA
jgi:hypothetical protein